MKGRLKWIGDRSSNFYSYVVCLFLFLDSWEAETLKVYKGYNKSYNKGDHIIFAYA